MMKLRCLICKDVVFEYQNESKLLKVLFTHVKRKHNLSKIEYYTKYIDHEFNVKKCGWCGKDATKVKTRYKNDKIEIYYNEGKMLCDNEDCMQERKKYNIQSY